MLSIFRLATVVYALTVFTAGYVAFATIKGLWNQAAQLNNLSQVAERAVDGVGNTLDNYDNINPAAGGK